MYLSVRASICKLLFQFNRPNSQIITPYHTHQTTVEDVFSVIVNQTAAMKASCIRSCCVVPPIKIHKSPYGLYLISQYLHSFVLFGLVI